MLRKRSTDAERLLWQHLRARQLDGLKFRRQQPIGNAVVDFVCFERRVIVELDGGHHALQKKQDRKRDAALADSGFEVMRFWNTEVLKNLDGVLEQIRECCLGSDSPRTFPPLDGGGLASGEGSKEHQVAESCVKDKFVLDCTLCAMLYLEHSTRKNLQDARKKVKPTGKGRLRVKDSADAGVYDHYFKELAVKHGFRDYTDYLEYLAKQRGFHSVKEYLDHWRKTKKGALTEAEYVKQLAERKGVKTTTQYNELLMKERAKRPRYRELAETLRYALDQLGISAKELAEKTGIAHQHIREYLSGYMYPRPERLKKIGEALRLYHLMPPQKETRR